MQTRRGAMASLTGAAVLLGCGTAAWAEEDETPTAKLIAGKPAVLDYGGGVKVPCTKDAFFTLWEGDRFWLTFGFGRSPSSDIAVIRANKQAIGVMKFMLLTLAFAPDRVVKGEGNGWRKKDPTAHDFVLGDLDLPLRPAKALSDAFLGAGNVEISPFWNFGGGGVAPMEEVTRGQTPTSSGAPTDFRQAFRNAFSSQVVLKKDLSLEDVRKHATVLQM